MAERRPNLKKPGYTATGRQWQTIDALCRDGWVVLDKGEANMLRVALRGLIDCHDAMDHKATDICEFVAEARRVLARIDQRFDPTETPTTHSGANDDLPKRGLGAGYLPDQEANQ